MHLWCYYMYSVCAITELIELSVSQISVDNPSSKSLTYTVMLKGQDAASFVVHDEMIKVGTILCFCDFLLFRSLEFFFLNFFVLQAHSYSNVSLPEHFTLLMFMAECSLYCMLYSSLITLFYMHFWTLPCECIVTLQILHLLYEQGDCLIVVWQQYVHVEYLQTEWLYCLPIVEISRATICTARVTSFSDWRQDTWLYSICLQPANNSMSPTKSFWLVLSTWYCGWSHGCVVY